MRSLKRIRILHVGKFYSPVQGGIENVVQELVTSIQADPAFSADVLVAQRKGPASVDLIDGAMVRRVRSHGQLFSLPVAPSLPAEIERLAGGYEIVHVHVPNPLLFFCDWTQLHRHGTRLIVHFHSDIVRPAQRNLLRLMGRQERRFYEAADRILVTSEGLLRHSETLRPHRDKCTVLPLSIALDTLQKVEPDVRAETRSELGYSDADVVFFFLGRLVYYKGVHDLLRAAARSGLKVLVGGEGPLRDELGALAAELGITHNVQFLGRIPDERLPAIYTAADVFVLPSNSPAEAFGLVQLEAMAHGLPIINTDLPTGVPDVSLTGVSGLTVPPNDAAALATAMQRLAADEHLRQRYGLAGLRRVRDYNRPVVTENLRKIYRDVLRGPIDRISAA